MIPDLYCWWIGLLNWGWRNVDNGFKLVGYIAFFGFTLHIWLKAFGL